MSETKKPKEESLGRLFGQIIKELRLNRERYILYITTNARRRGLTDHVALSKMINSVRRELFKPSITWKNFMRGLLFFNLKKVVFAFEHEGVHITHEVDIEKLQELSGTKREAELYGQILKEIFDKIVERFIPDEEDRNACIDRYCESQDLPTNKKQSDKGNIRKETRRSTMTWRAFIKLMGIFGIKNFNFAVTMITHNNQSRTAAITVNL